MRKPNQLHATTVVCGFVPCSHVLIFIETAHNIINIPGIFQMFASQFCEFCDSKTPACISAPLSTKPFVNKQIQQVSKLRWRSLQVPARAWISSEICPDKIMQVNIALRRVEQKKRSQFRAVEHLYFKGWGGYFQYFFKGCHFNSHYYRIFNPKKLLKRWPLPYTVNIMNLCSKHGSAFSWLVFPHSYNWWWTSLSRS